MISVSQQSGARLAINQQNHVNPGIRKAQDMVAAGDIGEVVLDAISRAARAATNLQK